MALIEPGGTLSMDAGTATLARAEALAPGLATSLIVARARSTSRRRFGAAVFLLGEALTAGPLAIVQVGRL